MDARAGWGPLGGLRTFLNAHSLEMRLLVYPVDMPLLDLKILDKLVKNLEINPNAEAIHYKDFEFPLVLSVSENLRRILDNLLALPDSSRRSIRSLLLSLRTLRIPLRPEDRIKLMNINTPEDWRICCEFENLNASAAN